MTTEHIETHHKNSLFAYAVTGGTSELSPSAPVLFRGDIYDSIDQAVQIGFDSLEWHVRAAEDIDAAKLKEYCDRHNFRIAALATGMANTMDQLSLIDEEPTRRQCAINRLIEIIDAASQLNCVVIIGYMRGNIPDFNEYEKYESLLMDSLRQVACHAESKNVMLVLEAINKEEVNYLNGVKETTDLVKRLDHPNLKVHIDTFHMDQEETDMLESIVYCGEHIGYVHYVDRHRRIPGEACIDFTQITQALIQAGYRGTISLEYPPYGDAYQSAERGLSYVKTIEQQCRRDQQLERE
ncbi:sugar phosphate isomerase/epimerase [Brevibacillus fluminis]|uniref:Sugar phosphate isomerase/epimerase n=1 Tax=Brevibacillus fluminis TaxID=511487 RepID=A0A3M8CZE3_9BACL|nr:sugar phosphate isomerase/epimerase family protein [Brevibacillus fluminis]RNB80255.1 sugar phosphate isomerase/epimerase [Brevibacillus fluminis]